MSTTYFPTTSTKTRFPQLFIFFHTPPSSHLTPIPIGLPSFPIILCLTFQLHSAIILLRKRLTSPRASLALPTPRDTSARNRETTETTRMHRTRSERASAPVLFLVRRGCRGTLRGSLSPRVHNASAVSAASDGEANGGQTARSKSMRSIGHGWRRVCATLDALDAPFVCARARWRVLACARVQSARVGACACAVCARMWRAARRNFLRIMRTSFPPFPHIFRGWKVRQPQ